MVRGRRGGPIGELPGALGFQRLFDLEAEESCAGIGISSHSNLVQRGMQSPLGNATNQQHSQRANLRPFPIPSDFLITIASLPIRLKAHLKSAESIKAMTLSQQPHRGKAATKSPSNSSITHVRILSSPIQSPKSRSTTPTNSPVFVLQRLTLFPPGPPPTLLPRSTTASSGLVSAGG